MLAELSITNFAIMDSLRVSFGPGLNVLTGETGAGKSILLDAITTLLGERATADVVRTGAERAIVEGVFDVGRLPASHPAVAAENEDESLSATLTSLDLAPEDGMLILGREITRAGRTLARVNGRTAPVSVLQRIAASLVDIHGQGAHLALLRPERHVFYLDRYAGTEELRAQVAAQVGELRETVRELDRLRHDEREIARRVELLRFQVDDITATDPQPGELESLEVERRRLANAERLRVSAALAREALLGDERETSGAQDLIAGAGQALDDLLRLDPSLGGTRDLLEQAAALLDDAAANLRDYLDTVASDPERQAEVEERWDALSRLRRKYGATIEDILAYGAEAARELDELEHREARIGDLDDRAEHLRQRIGKLADQLSRKRYEAATRLGRAIERELADLNMRRARFSVEFRREEAPDGVPMPGPDGATVRYACGLSGVDHVEFLIAPNPGEGLKPLSRIASGGETSRLMLALKTILAHADAVPILIFDEIDAGISGQSGQTVAEKLWELGRTHQVLCVTHLAQIAALGDTHIRVAKEMAGDRTHTTVTPLNPRARAEEIALLLGGSTSKAALANARDLLERGATWKAQVANAPASA
jgi:DNA repair protein RecN (Recombination protein N)